MRKFSYIVTDEEGIHARPAGLIVKLASGFKSKITISKRGKEVDARRIFGIMSLEIKQGECIIITIEGEDEAIAETQMERFCMEEL